MNPIANTITVVQRATTDRLAVAQQYHELLERECRDLQKTITHLENRNRKLQGIIIFLGGVLVLFICLHYL
jgi:hypothetical protein